jgi:hypothetical protein
MTAVALVAKQYPGLPYISLCWPTTDHIMPWRLFEALYSALEEILGLE